MSGAYSSQYEAKLLALALVNYGESIVDCKETVVSLMKRVEIDSIGYPGHDAPWQPSVSWARESKGILSNTKDILASAMSKKKKKLAHKKRVESAVGNGQHHAVFL